MRRSLPWALTWLLYFSPALVAQDPTAGPTVQAFLFGDVLYTVADGDDPEGFKLGQIVAHGSATLSDRVLFFGELSITARSTGYGLAMERAILRYEASDVVKVSVGRFHTPISYWNTAFHHGLWLQGSVARPEAVKFGSRFIPVHFVGAMAEGQLPNSPVFYQVGVGNGRSTNIAGGGDFGDVNSDRAIVLSASLRPASLFGFRVGGGLYFDKVPSADDVDPDERIASGYVVWDRGPLDLITEYIAVRHDRDGSGPTSSDAYYVHAGVRLSGELRGVTPYARYESMDIDSTDSVFGSVLPDYEAVVAGIRYNFDALATLKIEYRNVTAGGGEGQSAFFFQTSFAIPMFGG